MKFLYNALDTFMKLIWHIKSCKLVDIKATLCFSEEHFIVKLAYQDLLTLVHFKPFDAFTLLPEPTLCRCAWHLISAQAVLLASAPVAHVCASV